MEINIMNSMSSKILVIMGWITSFFGTVSNTVHKGVIIREEEIY